MFIKMEEIILTDCIGFEWDDANQDKNWKTHEVSKVECEEVFFNQPLLLYEDIHHSEKERRLFVLGKTNLERSLFIVFTIRKKLIRVISARCMSRKERAIYEKVEKDTSI